MTTRSFWAESRRTARIATRELFEPLAIVLRAVTGSPQPKKSAKTKWLARSRYYKRGRANTGATGGEPAHSRSIR